MDLFEAKEKMARLMRKHGLTQAGWTWKFSKHITSKAGCCKHYIKRIELSRTFIWVNTVEHATEVMLHEIAHALQTERHGLAEMLKDGRNTRGHGPIWKAIAKEIGSTGERYTPAESHMLRSTKKR